MLPVISREKDNKHFPHIAFVVIATKSVWRQTLVKCLGKWGYIFLSDTTIVIWSWERMERAPESEDDEDEVWGYLLPVPKYHIK